MEWISTEERLPPNGVYVLVALYNGRPKIQMHFIMIAERMNEGWFDGHNGDSIIERGCWVSHWMPLPDKPKKEGSTI